MISDHNLTLSEISASITSDLSSLQTKLNLDFPVVEFTQKEVSEPFDAKKQELREKIAQYEYQQTKMSERFRSLNLVMHELVKESYEIKLELNKKVEKDAKTRRKDLILEEQKDEETIAKLTKELNHLQIENKSLQNRLEQLEYDSNTDRKADNMKSESLNDSLDSKSVSKSGYLFKRSTKNTFSYQRRFFTLYFDAGSNMYYLNYRQKEKGPVKELIPLPWCLVTPVTEGKNLKYEHTFTLKPKMGDKGKKVHYLSANTKAEMNEWVEALEIASDYHPSVEEILSVKTK